MIEVRRDLYMNEETGKRDDAGIEKVLPVTEGSP